MHIKPKISSNKAVTVKLAGNTVSRGSVLSLHFSELYSAVETLALNKEIKDILYTEYLNTVWNPAEPPPLVYILEPQPTSSVKILSIFTARYQNKMEVVKVIHDMITYSMYRHGGMGM